MFLIFFSVIVVFLCGDVWVCYGWAVVLTVKLVEKCDGWVGDTLYIFNARACVEEGDFCGRAGVGDGRETFEAKPRSTDGAENTMRTRDKIFAHPTLGT